MFLRVTCLSIKELSRCVPYIHVTTAKGMVVFNVRDGSNKANGLSLRSHKWRRGLTIFAHEVAYESTRPTGSRGKKLNRAVFSSPSSNDLLHFTQPFFAPSLE